MKCLADHGLCVPESVAIRGMDNIPEASYLVPGLSSVDFCMGEICRQAAGGIEICSTAGRWRPDSILRHNGYAGIPPCINIK